MSDTPQGDGTNTTIDPLNNVKAEFSRKIGNVEEQLKAMADANKQLLTQLSNLSQGNQNPAPKQEVDLEDLWYKDPKQAAARIQAQAEQSIENKINQRQAEAQKQTQTIQTLVRDFPELNDDSHPLTKRAVELYMGMDESDKKSPMAYKLAVKEAAAELEVKPLSKRSNDDQDSYSVGSRGTSQPQGGRGASKRGDLAPETIAFAKLVGLNTDDPKVLESLKNRASRKDWQKYR